MASKREPAADLRTAFCGLEFRNPIVVAAGVHGRDGETIAEVSRSGVAAVCTKTIVAQPAPDVLPCFVKAGPGMLNAVFGSDRSAEYWFTEGLRRAREGEARVIANLAGFSPEQAAELAVKAEAAGASLIELPTHCPHMGEILNAMYPGLNYPEPKLTDVAPMQASVRLIKRAVKVPVVVKLSGTFSHVVREWARGVKEAGADGIACADALGPALSIDIRTGQPRLGGPRGVGGLTGPGIMPLTLRMVLDIASTVDLPIIGVGGVAGARDAVEYLMAGASLVGVCTAGHMNGAARYAKIVSDLGALLAELGFRGPEEARGLTLRRIRERAVRGQAAVTAPVPAVVDEERCTACGRCAEVCAFGAVRMPAGGKARVQAERCIGCGLCVSVCPADCIRQEYYVASSKP
jgi:dihydroorotate dehydrogenase subfamily 1